LEVKRESWAVRSVMVVDPSLARVETQNKRFRRKRSDGHGFVKFQPTCPEKRSSSSRKGT
jgi:hypothetical protein